MRNLIVMVLMSLITCVHAQDFNANNISQELKLNANAVKRLEELHVTIKALDKVIIRHRYAITVLNEQGNEYAEYKNSYSTLEDLSDISGTLYDAAGRKVRSVKKKDIEDVAVSDGFSLMLDDRIKRHNFYCRQYPYTVEYEDEQVVSGSYSFPGWFPVPDEEFSVEQSRFIVETPPGYNLRIKANMISTPPQKTESTKSTAYTWELKNYPAIQFERLQPSITNLVPVVLVGPGDFVLGKHKGNMSSWLEFGKFQAELNRDRDQLPDNIKAEVHRLTDGINDREEKIRTLYKFMQQNTRYVSVQLGVGGWQPFDAKYVAANKYGDCKALSNYMVSLLKEAGIRANYVIVNAGNGRRSLWEDFPAPYFNHVIACVPGDKDTTWLECTSQTESAGFMGTFTGDRLALLVGDDGGHVVRTPAYSEDKNLQLRSVSAKVDGEGNLVADVQTACTGTQQEHWHSLIHSKTDEELNKILNGGAMGLSTYTVEKFKYEEEKSKIPKIQEVLHVTAPAYATVTGKRIFVEPNLFNKSRTRFDNGERKFPIEFSSAYTDVDTVHIDIPEGYSPESVPRDVGLNTDFGAYSISFKVGNGRIDMIRSQVIRRSQFPASYYPELVKYFEAVYKADRSRIVLVKKEG